MVTVYSQCIELCETKGTTSLSGLMGVMEMDLNGFGHVGGRWA